MRRVARIEGLAAGEAVTGLELVLLDSNSALARQPASGRVSVSWRSGNPRRSWKGTPLELPSKLNVGWEKGWAAVAAATNFQRLSILSYSIFWHH